MRSVIRLLVFLALFGASVALLILGIGVMAYILMWAIGIAACGFMALVLYGWLRDTFGIFSPPAQKSSHLAPHQVMFASSPSENEEESFPVAERFVQRIAEAKGKQASDDRAESSSLTPAQEREQEALSKLQKLPPEVRLEILQALKDRKLEQRLILEQSQNSSPKN